MNIFEMAIRRDPNLKIAGSRIEVGEPSPVRRVAARLGVVPRAPIRATKRRVRGQLYRGLSLSGGATFTLVRPFRFSRYRSGDRLTGWQAVCETPLVQAVSLEVLVADEESSDPVASHRLEVSDEPIAVTLPPSLPQSERLIRCDVVVRLHASRGERVFLMVHEVLDRAPILALCKGKGVEIGPGLNPQVRRSQDVDVVYVEQATPEQWESLYDKKDVDRSLWKHYVQGTAFPLPAPDESLDFIFSSHVFEHLANPLGHLRHWRGKLRTGGVVVAVVPDFTGCKDYVFEPTEIAEIVEEELHGFMEPQLRHYVRWAAIRAPSEDPKSLMDKQRSIHVHFYTKDNMTKLLEKACKELGFRSFQITHASNHKDFYFVLQK